MVLSECRRGARVQVLHIHAEEALALRLRALGLTAGATATVLRVSPRRKVFLVGTEEALFALGAPVAAQVEVCP